MTDFGQRLRDLRKEKHLSQEELAKQMNISRSSIGMFEQGRRKPDFEMQEAFADFFNVNMDYLFGREDDPDIVLVVEMMKTMSGKQKSHLIKYADLIMREFADE